ncbi:MAG: peptidoglycan-binding protein [Coriobacteriia bacterium]|nr:peptidoglycan-binding protein [Coriobacteriia bacterium]
MIPIKIHDSGRGVEDIQRRLKQLGYDLGKSGVDGDFREETRSAVVAFQKEYALPMTGEVDSRTWSTLVDSTFIFGDRSLYLRKPHFHGQDVKTLQTALIALGFSSTDIDGIFGPHTERAVIEFQTNMEISPDGAVGIKTYEALNGLRHIWDKRDVHAHSEAVPTTQNREPVLMSYQWYFTATDKATKQIVRRLVNLASASADLALITQCDECRQTPIGEDSIEIVIVGENSAAQYDLIQIPYDPHRATLISSWQEATKGEPDRFHEIAIVMPKETLETINKLHFQFIAAVILDTLCAVFG